MSHDGPKPATLEDAAIMALDEALGAAGYAEVKHQHLGAEDLDAELLWGIWMEDATLQEAARTAVEVVAARGRLLKAGEPACVI